MLTYKTYLSVLFLSITLALTGCKSSKTISEGDKNFRLSAKQLIKENARKSPDFKTLQSKLKITYSEGEKRHSHTVSYRMQKDEVLWMSATFGVIRAKITPKTVAFYNKLDNTYFEGDFEYFSKLLGTDLNFERVQNIILGEALFNLKDESYKVSVHEGSYLLQPKNQRTLFEIFFLLNPSHYKVKSQQLSQITEQRHLQIDYLTHQEVDTQVLPEHIKVIAVEGTDEMIAELEFKSVSLNEDLRFPFKIPSGFKKIEL
ncbi:DUF4292 domain-containing protein [Algibacter sp. 2305UL17-15]|uniref:DUF4292 domain-containing protein n=1 Tax=Algibacter sp. 2305UL17-15 TaxID=3231268 RepID=UPI0034594C48